EGGETWHRHRGEPGKSMRAPDDAFHVRTRLLLSESAGQGQEGENSYSGHTVCGRLGDDPAAEFVAAFTIDACGLKAERDGERVAWLRELRKSKAMKIKFFGRDPGKQEIEIRTAVRANSPVGVAAAVRVASSAGA